MKEIEGKVALVTGGSSGIGRSTALAFAREGARVVVADIVVESGEETAQMINDSGGQAVFIKADVIREEEVKALIDRSVEAFGHLDYAFNNAGINGEDGKVNSITTLTEENWNQVINTNLKGVWLCMKYEIPQMLKQGGGAIVNTSSIAGLVGVRGNPAYGASKHGVVSLTKNAALEYAQKGVRVNAVCPASIDTPMVRQLIEHIPKMEKVLTNMQPMGRLGQPEEVAEAVVWLCSDAASFVIGHTLTLDGGMVAQ